MDAAAAAAPEAATASSGGGSNRRRARQRGMSGTRLRRAVLLLGVAGAALAVAARGQAGGRRPAAKSWLIPGAAAEDVGYEDDDDRDDPLSAADAAAAAAGAGAKVGAESIKPWYAEAGADGGLGSELGDSILSQDEAGKAGGAAGEQGKKHQQHQHRRHHPFWPLHTEDFWGLLFTALGLMIAAGGGIGGGGILVPIFILVMGFSPKYAIPLSNVTILGGSIMNMVMNVSKRHPSADRPLVDWDLILIMEPLTIGGALAGSFLNKMLPEWLLVVSLVILLGYTAQTTLDKAVKVYQKETEAQLKAARPVSTQLKTLQEQEAEAEAIEEKTLLLSPDEYEAGGGAQQHAAKAELQAILEAEQHTPWVKVRLLVFCFVVVLVLNLFKGGGHFPSPLGVECGSFAFWFITLMVFAWVIGISLYVRQDLIKVYYTKAKVGYKYAKGDIEWDEWATIKYPCICFFAGFFAGMFGVGGGIVKGPLMLEMGVDPQVASASSACMILFTSFTATTSFYIFDLLVYDYALWLFLIGFVFTSIGQFGLTYLMRKYNRNSYIIFSIGAVVGLSAVLMGLQSVISLMWGKGSSGGGGSICDAAA